MTGAPESPGQPARKAAKAEGRKPPQSLIGSSGDAARRCCSDEGGGWDLAGLQRARASGARLGLGLRMGLELGLGG